MKKPTQLYEINTAVYLARLSGQIGRHATLADMPEDFMVYLAERGIDSIWMMGVWQRSPMAARMALESEVLIDECRDILPDFQTRDIIGSAYAIYDYRVDERFGGENALRLLRAKLSAHGIALILDFVPNHTALDHAWVTDHPTYYIQGTPRDMADRPEYFFSHGDQVIANGRDPHYPAWRDTAQTNAFSAGYRAASIATLNTIATMCDGVRCDMAMLMMNDIFATTWDGRVAETPPTEYWHDVITATRHARPDFIFIAEAYWQTELDLIKLGFDFCYDKTLYDLLVAGDMPGAERHIQHYDKHLDHFVYFIENHDEQRAATMPLDRHKAAAQFIARLPGLTLWHDGQWQGASRRIPVQLGRGADEADDPYIKQFYDQLLTVTPPKT